MTINEVDYPVIGKVNSIKAGHEVPILNIKMMSDERWMELTNTPEQIERRRKRALEMAGELHG